MFTQSMPQLAQALAGALPDDALRQLMQSLGNCQQPLTHRGAVNIQAPDTTGINGLAKRGRWNPATYRDIMPNAGDGGYVDIPGSGGNSTTNNYNSNTNNYGGSQFSFPTNQAFNYSNYYGGDTFNVDGNTTFNNINTTTINNTTVVNNGGGGGFGGGGGGGFFPPPGGGGGGGGNGGGGGGFGPGGGGGGFPFPFPFPFPGGGGRDGKDGKDGKDGSKGGKVKYIAPTGKGKLTISPTSISLQGSVEVPTVTGATLNADSCTVTLTYGTEMKEVMVSGTVTPTGSVTVDTKLATATVQ